ncbi:hypothetical protein K505DRAFT_72621 [Melanomma pulvis-pyrius CBS 109.77]|uniref:Uncharacterized protein n=1 Tax=Melanomma pulvis-pyrius CBS 109.77 TaxID=1314802 RepID=A0A6A6X3F4_9PLEO|nr:hypothetical protein K505DRAFT_72621 [Melanomma pulvis-pyrius CBS 109.77]
MTSCPKLSRRLDSGARRRNLHCYLTRTRRNIAEDRMAGNSASSFVSRIGRCTFSKEQTEVIRRHIVLFKSAGTPLGDLTAWDEALECGEAIYYNDEGRLRFQMLLGLAVTDVVDAMRELSNGIQQAHICKRGSPAAWKSEDSVEDHAMWQEWTAHLELTALILHAATPCSPYFSSRIGSPGKAESGISSTCVWNPEYNGAASDNNSTHGPVIPHPCALLRRPGIARQRYHG